jgi:inward rectifier potassium channel
MMLPGVFLLGLLRRRRRPPVVLPMLPDGSRRSGRLVHSRRSVDALRLDFPARWHNDLYHHTLVLSWWVFLLAGSGLYLVLNLVFAGLYLLEPGSIANARPGSFGDAFFFSIQTMATIGYGVMTPSGTYANIVMTLETMVSLTFAAVTTGVTFARFSRPTARVTFSRFVTVAPYNGVPTLTVRLSNSRRNQILEADVRVTLLRNVRSVEGQTMRRFYDMALSRGHTPIFALSFTVMHPIDEQSPLFGATPESLAREGAELLVTVTGIDETMSQTIHARISYGSEDIRFGHRFVDMFGYTPSGQLVIDYGNFDQIRPVDDATRQD